MLSWTRCGLRRLPNAPSPTAAAHRRRQMGTHTYPSLLRSKRRLLRVSCRRRPSPRFEAIRGSSPRLVPCADRQARCRERSFRTYQVVFSRYHRSTVVLRTEARLGQRAENPEGLWAGLPLGCLLLLAVSVGPWSYGYGTTRRLSPARFLRGRPPDTVGLGCPPTLPRRRCTIILWTTVHIPTPDARSDHRFPDPHGELTKRLLFIVSYPTGGRRTLPPHI